VSPPPPPKPADNPRAPPAPPPGNSVGTNGASSDFAYSFHQGNAILNYDPEQRRMSLVGTDIFGGQLLGNTFKQNRTARWDLDLVFEGVRLEFKDCMKNKNPKYPQRFSESVLYDVNLKEGGKVTGTLRLDAEATRAAGLSFAREEDEPKLEEFELNFGGKDVRFFPKDDNVFGFEFGEGQLFSFQETQFVNNCSYEESSYKDRDENDVPSVPAPYIFARFCHDTFDLDVEVACRATDPRTGEIRETTGWVMSVVPEAFRKVDIDIIPGFAENHLVPSSELPLAVAILASKDFSPNQTVCESVKLGKASAVFCLDGDTNSDGLTDRVAVVKAVGETGIVCESTELALTARMSTGEHILGTDAIEPVLCRKEGEIK